MSGPDSGEDAEAGAVSERGGDQEELAADDTGCLNRLIWRPGARMTADILTKLLEPPLHWRHMESLGYIPVPPEAEELAKR